MKIQRLNRHYSKSSPRLLPPIANEFIELLATTHKPNTCRHYKTTLRAFYTFLESQRCSIKRITRKHLMFWFTQLNAKKLSASTRQTYITYTRIYLCWLFEQQLINANPADLIRSADIPRRPSYLPRPLPPDVDLELQQRFARSDDPLQKGLLLMRHTGIRIGELISLPYHCVRNDFQGSTFLKVPLGKLDNERLVPMDDHTVTLVEEIQAWEPSPRIFLFETPSRKKVPYNSFRQSLNIAAHGIVLPEPVTSHRLRHSYATSLLSAGMKLESIMRLLGHRDFNMTLRYADVTLDTIRKEFFEATGNIQKQYGNTSPCYSQDFNPIHAISDIVAWLKKARDPTNFTSNKQAQRLINRTDRLKHDLETFAHTPGIRGLES